MSKDATTHFGSFEQYIELLNECLEEGDTLTRWERDYIEDLLDKAETYGEEVLVSDRQAVKVREILEQTQQ